MNSMGKVKRENIQDIINLKVVRENLDKYINLSHQHINVNEGLKD